VQQNPEADTSEYPRAYMHGPAVSLLADIYALEGDIDNAGQFATTLLMLLGQDPPEGSVEHVLTKATWNAALISYRRAFTTGRAHLLDGGSRLNLRDVVEQIVPEEHSATHAELMRLANGHVAHRTDRDLDKISFALVLAPDGSAPRIHSTELLQERWIGPDSEFVASAIELMKIIRNRLTEELRMRVDLFVERVKAEHSMSELYGRSVQGRRGHGG
jgi:hypothetical protein